MGPTPAAQGVGVAPGDPAELAALSALLDATQDALLQLDAHGQVRFRNRAAQHDLRIEPGLALVQLAPALGAPAVEWLREGLQSPPPQAASIHLRLGDGRFARLERRAAGDGLALAVRLIDAAWSSPDARLSVLADGHHRQWAEMVWDSPFPVTVQDANFRLVAVNDAYERFAGRPQEALIGLDPIELQPTEDRSASLAARAQLRANPQHCGLPPLVERRLVDAEGRVRWFRLSRRFVRGAQGDTLMLTVLQDSTAEHAAREQADRSLREIDEWFDLSPIGMVLYDERGLIVRSNAAFEALVGHVPVTLDDAPAALQALLGWADGAPRADLRGGAAVEYRAELVLPDGRHPRLRALVRSWPTPGGQRRVMAAVEDRSVEHERDLAQLQIGALTGAAGVGVATFEAQRGWLRGTQAVDRELVEPASRPAYDRLQSALARGDRADVRYAVRDPMRGQRWLHTWVEPGRLASGGRTSSVVTVDVTEQAQAHSRSEQLLREMSTILAGSSAGIAYLRGQTLVRCNEPFERLLGIPPAHAAGASITTLFAHDESLRSVWLNSLAALRSAPVFEAEFRGRDDGTWYSLSMRRAATSGDDPEAVAVLTDVSRLKAQQAALENLARERERTSERTRALLDSVLVGIVTVGERGIEWMNRSARRMFAGELADFVGASIDTVAGPEADHPLRRSDRLHTLTEGQAESFECRLVARDGRQFWVVGNAVAIGDGQGGRQLMFALLDIESRRQAEVRIAQAQASLARIIETAPLGIVLLDPHRLQVLQLNRVAADYLGRPIAEAIGLTPAELVEPSIAAGLMADMRLALDSGEVVRREIRHERRGVLQVLDARYVPISSPQDNERELLVVASDVTEQRAAETARYEAAIAQRDLLVREVHHRIKNNLQGVAGLMQQAAQRRPEVASIIREAIGQVQAIAQVYGLQVGADGPVRVPALIEAVVQSVRRMFGRTIELDTGAPLAQRWALPEAESIPIALTVNELLTNALKHAGAEAVVRCALRADTQELRIEIENPGRLPEGFDLGALRGGVSGLGLVRALLPRRSATLALSGEAGVVRASVVLVPPGVSWIDAP